MGRGRERSDARAPRDCHGCGRSITWRRAWAATWEEVRWCSDACRRRGIRPVDRQLEAALLRLLDAAPHAGTVAPDEAIATLDVADPQTLVEPARRAARRLVAQGRAEILQDGRVVDPSTARGPIRVRRVRSVG